MGALAALRYDVNVPGVTRRFVTTVNSIGIPTRLVMRPELNVHLTYVVLHLVIVTIPVQVRNP